MSPWTASPVRVGLAMGVIFGLWTLAHSLLFPLADDTIPALLLFYGPMFALWGLSGALAARSSRSWTTGRADWQSMMRRFQASRIDSLRTFVTVEYIKASPFKIAVATAIGAVFGSLGASLGWILPAPAFGRRMPT